MPEPMTFFATCAPGLEPLLHREVRGLRLPRVEQQVGGVRFGGDLRDAWRACLWLRSAVRVRRWLSRFQAPDGEALYRGAAAVDWSEFVESEGTLVVDALSSDSALTHTQFVEQRVKDAIVDQFRERCGSRPTVQKKGPDLRVHLHLFRDRATLAVDCSGESLHKRGWRRYQGRAPLAETTAAALVLLSDWDRRAPLVDPFCGSGTVLIEAALIASNTAPGLLRERFGFEAWRGHDAAGWERAKGEARDALRPLGKLRLVGRDLEPEHIVGARENLAAAGLADAVELEIGDAREQPLRPGWNAWIVSNLPYGERVGSEAELEPLFRDLGALLRERAAGYQLALLSGSPRLARKLGLRWDSRTALRNGSLEIELLRAAIHA